LKNDSTINSNSLPIIGKVGFKFKSLKDKINAKFNKGAVNPDVTSQINLGENFMTNDTSTMVLPKIN